MPGLKTSAEDLAQRRQSRRTTALLGSDSPPAKPDDSVDRNSLAPHPKNWRTELGDVSDLAQSMRGDVGILEPLVVTTRAAHLAAWPDDAKEIGKAEYVVICGHRRLAAAEIVGLEKVPVVIRPELSADGKDIEAMVIENARRQNFDPLDEARAFAALVQRGRRQEDIAEAVGCTQSHVSKRLQLLKLAVPVQNAIALGRLRVKDALAIGRLQPEYQVAAWEASWKATLAEPQVIEPDSDEPDKQLVARGPVVAAAVARQRQEQTREERTAESRTRAAAQNLPLIDAANEFGENAWQHRLDDEEAIERARVAGTLRAAIDETGGLYLLTAERIAIEPPVGESSARSAENLATTVSSIPAASSPAAPAPARTIPSQKADPATTDLVNANRARHVACARLAARKPAAAEALRRLAGAVVTLAPSREALRLAHQWLQEAGIVGEADAGLYADTVAEDSAEAAVVLAAAIVLAADELHTRRAQQVWDKRAAAHVRRLMTDAKYVPTAIESRLLQEL